MALNKKDHKVLGLWAARCAGHVLHYFEEKYPKDKRPRHAIKMLHQWVKTGVFKMAVIRKASLDSHAAAREVGEDNAARSAARAAGQAVATAHHPLHSLGAANYAYQSIVRASNSSDVKDAIMKERNWQYKLLPKRLHATVRNWQYRKLPKYLRAIVFEKWKF